MELERMMVLNDELLKLAKKKKKICDEKHDVVRRQAYEEAVILREKERVVIEDIEKLIVENGFEYVGKNDFALKDLHHLISLVEYEDPDFLNAINKLKVEEYERFHIMKNAELYHKGEITAGQLNDEVKKSIHHIRTDLISKTVEFVKELGPNGLVNVKKAK